MKIMKLIKKGLAVMVGINLLAFLFWIATPSSFLVCLVSVFLTILIICVFACCAAIIFD